MNPSGDSSRPDLTRRAFLGAAIPAVAGAAFGAWKLAGAPSPKRAIDGEIVGANHAWGHKLRGGDLPPVSRTLDVPVAIIGGGIAGLSAAWKLDKSGFGDFRVFELESSAGGNSRYGENSVSAYPWGAHYVPLPTKESRAVRELFQDLGVITGYDAAGEPVYEERHLCHAPQERLYIHGRWQEGIFPTLAATEDDLAQLRRFRDRILTFRARRDAQGRKSFALPVETSGDDPEARALDEITMRAWLDREGFTSPRLRWYVDYACRDDYGCTIETTSAFAGLHYFVARDSGHNGDEAEVLTWPEGNGWIVKQLAARVGPRLSPQALAFRVDPEAGTVDYVDTSTGEAVRIRARRIIFALPRFVASRVVPGVSAAGFTYAPWMVANLTVDRLPEGGGLEPAWDNVFYESRSLGYVVATHQTIRVHDGPSVMTYYQPLTGDPPSERQAMLARPWSDWKTQILADLRHPHPSIEEAVSRIDVMLWGHAMVRPVPGLIWEKARNTIRSIGRVSFAHSDLSGLSLFEEAQYHGVRAAEETLQALGRSFTSSL